MRQERIEIIYCSQELGFDARPEVALTILQGAGRHCRNRSALLPDSVQCVGKRTGIVVEDPAVLTVDDMVDVIARHCGVPARAVGHAGMKDKMAVTRQTVSVHLPGLPDPPVLQHPSMEFMWARRHTAKLRPGQLRGNRFSIRIRQVNPLHAPRVQQAMQVFASRGAPNAFGFQRFGHRRTL